MCVNVVIISCLLYVSHGRKAERVSRRVPDSLHTRHTFSCTVLLPLDGVNPLDALRQSQSMSMRSGAPNHLQAFVALVLAFAGVQSKTSRHGLRTRVNTCAGLGLIAMHLPLNETGTVHLEALERRAWRRDMQSQVLRFAGPALSTVLADPLMSVVDAVCCGRFCETLQLASLGPPLAVFNFASYLFFFLNAATTVQVSKALANDDCDSAASALADALFIAVACGLVGATLLWTFAWPLVSATGCVPELVATAAQYTRIRGIGQPVVLASMVLTAGLLAQRDSVTPLNAVLFACFLNILGDVFLVPKFGAVGAAWATLLSQTLSLPLLLYLSKKRRRLPVRLRLPSGRTLAPLVSTCRPIFLFEIGMSTCYTLIQSLSTQFSVVSTAAFQALWNPVNFVCFGAYPLKQACQVFFPRLAKDEVQTVGGVPKSKEFLKVITTLACVSGVVLSAAALACAAYPSIFTQDASLWPMIRSFAPFVAPAIVILPCAQAFEGVLLGIGDLAYLSQSQLLNVITVITTFFFTKMAGMGIHGAWVVLFAFYSSRAWQGAIRIVNTFLKPSSTALNKNSTASLHTMAA